MVYELKKYIAQPGTAQALRQRFAEVTMPIFDRVGIKIVYCFESDDEPDALYYVTAFDTSEKRDTAWRAFAADEQWKVAKAASEVEGPLLASQSTLELRPTVFSPTW